jgi:hypothetical protein
MKIGFYILLIFLLISCKETVETEIKSKDVYYGKLVNFIISNPNGNSVELHDLYDSTTDSINNYNEEKLKLVEILKSKGFQIVDYGRGNYPPLGPRIVSISLKKNRCKCEVDKIYYFTSTEGTFTTSERIKCYWTLK